MHIASSVVVRIKKISVLRNFRAISRKKLFQDERLEKPSRMGKVPFGRADVGDRLYDVILRFKPRAQPIRKISDLVKTSTQAFSTRPPRIEMRLFPRCRIGNGVS